MRPTRAGADLGPAPGPQITGLRSVGPNLPATPVGASSRSGRLRSPSGPDRPGSIPALSSEKRFPVGSPLTRGGGTASGFPARWNPPPISGHRIPGARHPDPEPGAVRPVDPPAPGSRPGSHVLGGPLLRPRPGPYRLAPYRSGRFQKRCSPRTIDIMRPEVGLVNPKREIPSPFPRIGEKSPPAPGFPHLCPHLRPRSTITRRPASSPAQPSPGGHTRCWLGYHPAAGQQPRSIITRRRVSGRSVMIPSTPKSKRRCISPGSSMVQT